MSASQLSLLEAGHETRLMEAMRLILSETGGHNTDRYTYDYWKWQYRQLPTQKALVAVASQGERIVGYYHIPLYGCTINGQARHIGNIQDVAMAADCRGKGAFRDLAVFANAQADLDPSAHLIYTFPNHRSIHTFLKYNAFQKLITYPTYVMPLRPAAIGGSKVPVLGHVAGALAGAFLSLFRRRPRMAGQLNAATAVNEKIASVFEAYGRNFACHLNRSQSWLTWRYENSPRGKHWFFTSTVDGHTVAAAVVKVDPMFGQPALVLMDFAHATGHATELVALLATVARNHAKHGVPQCNLVFYAGSAPINKRLPAIGFLPVPDKINPRPLNLLVRNCGGAPWPGIFDPANWLVTLGDWDVL